jgi:hypothetical protein
LKEKIVSKTNFDQSQQDAELRENELNAVSGGGGEVTGGWQWESQGAPIAVSPDVGMGVGGGGGGSYSGIAFHIHYKN